MIPRECKRLAEVDFPIAAVSRHAVREKSIRHGHPSTLHLWWARRPLASCRAMLMALLLPDPCEPLCPPDFKSKAREILRPIPGRVGTTDEELREALLRFIGDFADWDRSANPTFLEAARSLVKAAYPDETPLVVDPFAGGGSIPLEAMRLGCDSFASDLNPVACLILKTILEDIPRYGPSLANDLHDVGLEIKTKVESELAAFYPPDPDGAWPIAYLWARTVRCEAPSCGAEIPLVRSFWLSKKANRRRALRYAVGSLNNGLPRVVFEIFTPKSDSEVPVGTVARAKATCRCCGTALAPERVRSQLAAERGGANTVFDPAGNRIGGARMLAVVTLKPGEQGRYYRLPTERDYEVVRSAQAAITKLNDAKLANGLSTIPKEPLPPIGTLGFRVQRYGMTEWGDLFTARQKVAFIKFGEAVAHANVSEPLKQLLAMVCTKLADRCNSLVNWSVGVECPNQLFKGNAVPMAWDFAESNVLSNSSASFAQSLDNVARNAEVTYIPGSAPSSCQLADACDHPLADQASTVWFTDPPYYDAVPYSDLSDFFFVWFKRALPGNPLMRDPFDISNPLTPKRREAVQDETKRDNGRSKDRAWFEETMALAFAEGRRVSRDDTIASVIFAHKTTEGWEALLSGIIRGGWTITGSWPIATERYSRLRARDSAALATSVHLVCRPRAENKIGDWAEVLRELPGRVANWMTRLEREGIHGADLVFACIGPALEIFSRYSRVETPDGREVSLAEYLEKVWEVVGRTALEQVLGTAEAQARNGGLGALEEDARLTALFLWTLGATGEETNDEPYPEDNNNEAVDDNDDDGSATKAKGLTLVFDIVRRFAQPLGIHLDAWEGRIIETKKGVVRLLPVLERAMQLFGEAGADAMATSIENDPRKAAQLDLFPGVETDTPKIKSRGRKKAAAAATSYTGQVTTLDRVHAAMLLQRQGRTSALRSLLTAEAQRGPDFSRLANALSALYPQTSEEKRLLDAMLLAMPRR